MNIHQEILDIGSCILSQFNVSFPCGICGSEMKPFRFTAFIPLQDKPALVYECSECGFISRDFTRIDESAVRVDLIDYKLPRRGFESEMNNESNEEYLSCIMKYLPQSPIILDMGSGSGGFERSVNGQAKVVSFDLNRELIDFASTKGITIHSVDITNKEEIADKLSLLGYKEVDCIHSVDTFEHLINPYRVLKMWVGFLRDGGYIHILVPTLNYMFSEMAAFQPAHLSYFNDDTLTRLVEKVGLRIVSIVFYGKHNGAGTGAMGFLLQK